MCTQTEQELENNLILQLQTIGFEKVKIEDDKFDQDKKDADQAKMDTLKSWGTSS